MYAPGLIPFREFTWLKQSAETMLQELRDEHELKLEEDLEKQ